MKKQDLHSVLWQKRNELRINDDVQHDWLDMQSMLDVHIPVGNPPIGGAVSGTGNLFGLSGFKLLSVLLVTIGAATLIYYVSRKGVTEKTDPQKNTTAIATTNKIYRFKSAIKPNHADSLSAATASSGLNGITNRDKTHSGTPLTANTTGNANTADKTRAAGNNGIANNSLPDNKARVAANNDYKKAGRTIAANNKYGSNNSKMAFAGSAPLSGTKNANGLSAKGNPVAPGKGDKFAKNVYKKVATAPLSLSRDPNKNVKTTGPTAHVNRPTAGRTVHSPGTGHGTVSGNGLIRPRHGTGHSQTTVGASANIKLKGNNSSGKSIASRYGKNNVMSNSVQLNNKGITSENATLPPATRITGVYSELGPSKHAEFIAPRYGIPGLPGYLTGLFKDSYKMTDDTTLLDFNWHLMMGVNPSGSFTARNQNINFYGRLPVDVIFGLTGSCSFSDKWAASIGIRALTPRNISGSYTHKNDSKIDTLQTLNISDSRKLYFLEFPINISFKLRSNLNINAGAVLSMPVQEANGSSTFQTGKLQKDTSYYKNVRQNIDATTYTRGLIFGLSAGVGYQHGRFIFDASYARYLSLVPITSPLGSYSAGSNEFLFTVGFRLNRLKK